MTVWALFTPWSRPGQLRLEVLKSFHLNRRILIAAMKNLARYFTDYHDYT